MNGSVFVVSVADFVCRVFFTVCDNFTTVRNSFLPKGGSLVYARVIKGKQDAFLKKTQSKALGFDQNSEVKNYDYINMDRYFYLLHP